jgi:putative transposase
VILSYKYRIEPNQTQAAALDEMLGDFCQLYNAALDERISAYKAVANARHEIVWGRYKDRKGVEREGYIRRHLATVTASTANCINSHSQIVALPIIRRDLPHIARWSATAEQQIMRRVDKTFQAFFNRVKRGEKAGFPRFKPRDRFHAAEFRVGDGLTLRKSGKIGFVGVPGEIKVRWHRELPSKPKSAVLTRQGGKWYVVFHVAVAPVERAGPDSVGIDVGLTSLVALSTGEKVERPQLTKRAERELRRRQRAVARCKRGSKSRAKRKAALAKFQAHVAAKRRYYLHKRSRELVDRFGRIGIEDLNVKGLARSVLAKHVADASWGQLTAMLDYKAANAGVEIVRVDPRGTSQTCPECGIVAAKTLAERRHRCECGADMDRDVAAAMVVHFRAFGFWPGSGLGSLSERVAA